MTKLNKLWFDGLDKKAVVSTGEKELKLYIYQFNDVEGPFNIRIHESVTC